MISMRESNAETYLPFWPPIIIGMSSPVPPPTSVGGIPASVLALLASSQSAAQKATTQLSELEQTIADAKAGIL